MIINFPTIANYGSNYKYHHIYKGVNPYLDEIQAAVPDIKLSHLDSYNQGHKKQNATKMVLY